MRKFPVILTGFFALQISAAKSEVTNEYFLLKSSGDLVALCSATQDDPNYVAAIHYCHGCVVGRTHFNVAMGRAFEGKV